MEPRGVYSAMKEKKDAGGKKPEDNWYNGGGPDDMYGLAWRGRARLMKRGVLFLGPWGGREIEFRRSA